MNLKTAEAPKLPGHKGAEGGVKVDSSIREPTTMRGSAAHTTERGTAEKHVTYTQRTPMGEVIVPRGHKPLTALGTSCNCLPIPWLTYVCSYTDSRSSRLRRQTRTQRPLLFHPGQAQHTQGRIQRLWTWTQQVQPAPSHGQARARTTVHSGQKDWDSKW
jgi:hypothetical protein